MPCQALGRLLQQLYVRSKSHIYDTQIVRHLVAAKDGVRPYVINRLRSPVLKNRAYPGHPCCAAPRLLQNHVHASIRARAAQIGQAMSMTGVQHVPATGATKRGHGRMFQTSLCCVGWSAECTDIGSRGASTRCAGSESQHSGRILRLYPSGFCLVVKRKAAPTLRYPRSCPCPRQP